MCVVYSDFIFIVDFHTGLNHLNHLLQTTSPVIELALLALTDRHQFDSSFQIHLNHYNGSV